MFIASLVLAAFMAALMIVMLTRHGPIFVLHYFLLEKEQKKEARSKHEYRNAALWALIKAGMWLGVAAIVFKIPGWAAQVFVVALAVELLYFTTYNLRPQDDHIQMPPKDAIPKDAIC